MASIRKIPGSSHQQNDREQARGFFDKGEYTKALDLLKRYGFDEMEMATRLLAGKIELKLSNYGKAKKYFESIYATDRQNKIILRLLIETHNSMHEYQKVLFYLNHLFKLDGDVNEDIKNVLQLYRKLGLYDRALELQETMDSNNFFHEDYLEEKVLIALEIENHDLTSRILESNKELLRKKPLLNRALRRLQYGIDYIGIRRRLYLKFGVILLGSYQDNGLDEDPVYDSFTYAIEEIYETYLRFVDFCKTNHIKFSSIQCHDSRIKHISNTLALILGVPHTDKSDLNSSKNLPILHFHCTWQRDYKQHRGVHFSLTVSEQDLQNSDCLPNFIGVILKSNSPSIDNCLSVSLPQNPQILYDAMHDRKHVSTLDFEAREAMHRVQDLAFQKSKDILISKLPSAHEIPRRKPWDYKYLRNSLKNDGLLYVRSLLQTYKNTRMPKSQIRELLNACQLWGYNDPATLNYCSLVEPDLTMDFVQQDLLNPEYFVNIASGVDHIDTLLLLKRAMQKNNPEILSSGIWIDLFFEEEFEPWIESKISETSSHKYLLQGFENLVKFESFNTKWFINLATMINEEKNWSVWSRIASSLILINPDCKEAIKEAISKCNCLSPNISKLISDLSLVPNEKQKSWVLNNLKNNPEHCTDVIQRFSMDELLKRIFDLQKNESTTCLLKYSQLLNQRFKNNCKIVEDLISLTELDVQIELYAFLLYHSKDQYRLLDEIFLNKPLKLKMRPFLTKLFEITQDVSTEKDLLFLMEQDEDFRVATAKMLVFQGDMEFYIYLVYRLSTHGNEHGLEIFSVLYECRSEQAIEMLIQVGIVNRQLTKTTIINLIEYIEECESRMDEWHIFMNDETKSSLHTTLKSWLEQNFTESISLLIMYLRTFRNVEITGTVLKFIDLPKVDRYQLQQLYNLSPNTALELLDKLPASSRTRYLLTKDWQRTLN